MLSVQSFYECCTRQGIDFYAGVPDSLLQDFCAYLVDHAPAGRHVIAANEGGAVGLAAGHFLATGNPAVVYLQNSGQGNLLNPVLSLADAEVYGLPLLLLVGWRGQPGEQDEPQHVKQGRVMLDLFKAMEMPCEILAAEEDEAHRQVEKMVALARRRKCPVALVVRKGTFEKYRMKTALANRYSLIREQVIGRMVGRLPEQAAVVGTTGHISRELYEYHAAHGGFSGMDFLTVGSMGHASQIALGIALAQPERPVYCLDGDGAALMHMGGMAIIGKSGCRNIRHIVLNNGAHGSVGGQHTAAFGISLAKIAEACGYVFARSVHSAEELESALTAMAQASGPAFLEVRVSGQVRADLGRPRSSPAENRDSFMAFLRAPPRPGR